MSGFENTSLDSQFSANLILATFEEEHGDVAIYALDLVAHAALPVAFTAELLHLLRINFLDEIPEEIKYDIELKILFSALCTKLDEELGLYEIDPAIRIRLLKRLVRNFSKRRIEDVAYFLYQYTEKNLSWKERKSLYFAQKLSALNYIDPDKAIQWLTEAEEKVIGGEDVEDTWFVAVRKKIIPIDALATVDQKPDLQEIRVASEEVLAVSPLGESAVVNEHALQLLSVDDLTQRCAQETILYFKSRVHDTRYCFELFRRAVSERSELAWKAIIIQYKPTVARWVNRWADKHPDFPLARVEEEDFIDEAFIRFWNHFTPDRLRKSQGLDGVLKYLKICVESAILDSWRRQRRVNLEQEAGDEEPEYSEREPTPEDLIQKEEFWQLIRKKLSVPKEYTVAYASFYLGLSPREILSEYADEFENINEIYRLRANLSARLNRDKEFRDFLNKNDDSAK